MDNNDRPDLAFGPFRLEWKSRIITRDGIPVRLGARALEIFVALAEASGATVSKDALLEYGWPHQIIEENNLQVQVSGLRKTLGEGWIVTVPGRGYRLIVPGPNTSPVPANIFDRKPSIAVLPFASMSGELDQEHFSDGMAEDISTALSRVQSFFVISRNRSFAYKDRTIDARQLGRDLGVRYLLKGGVRGSGSRLRITAQLISTETGSHIWAERYDHNLADIFSVQDEITQAIVSAIEPAVAEAERHRASRRRHEDLGAWEAWQRALSTWSKGENLTSTREFLLLAVALDPNFAPAHAMLAQIYIFETTLGAKRPMQESLRLALAEARTAVELDSNSAIAHSMLAWVFHYQGDREAALEQAEIAINLNPNDPWGYAAKGHALVFSGRPGEARGPLATALRLDPSGPTALAAMQYSTVGFYLGRDYQNSEEVARRAIRSWPWFPRPYLLRVAALGQLGRAEEARSVLNATDTGPHSYFHYITRSRPPIYRPEDYEHLLDGLHKAGWRSQPTASRPRVKSGRK